MSMPLLLALFMAQGTAAPGKPATIPATPIIPAPAVQEPTKTVPPVTPVPFSYATPVTVAEPNRLALTPVLDGKLGDEEWDPLYASTDTKTYLQWEPGQIHVAATGPAGRDLVVSLDLGANGWLVGKDNLEVRVATVSGTPTVTARLLDATNVAGPTWQTIAGIGMASKAVVSGDATNQTVEVSIVDPAIGYIWERAGQKMAVRADFVPSGDAPAEPFLPRSLAPIQLVNNRAAALPSGLRYGVERADRPVVPGDGAIVRFTFESKGSLGLKKLDLRASGLLKDTTTQTSLPFPAFDNKGRAFKDYTTKIPADAQLGYRVAKATITGGDGVPGVVETSFRVAPDFDIDLIQEKLQPNPKDRGIRMNFYMQSFANRSLSGEISLQVPTGFRVMNGGDQQKFTINDRRGRIRKGFDLFIPGEATGTFPILFTIVEKGKRVTHTSYVNILP